MSFCIVNYKFLNVNPFSAVISAVISKKIKWNYQYLSTTSTNNNENFNSKLNKWWDAAITETSMVKLEINEGRIGRIQPLPEGGPEVKS